MNDLIPYDSGSLQSLPDYVIEKIRSVLGSGWEFTTVRISITKKGYRKYEFACVNSYGSRRFFVLTDRYSHISSHEVQIIPDRFEGSRNEEIRRLRKEEKLTQQFLGDIFRLSQARISQILHESL